MMRESGGVELGGAEAYEDFDSTDPNSPTYIKPLPNHIEKMDYVWQLSYAFDEGLAAGKTRKGLNDNPFDGHYDHHEQWEQGWAKATREIIG